MGSGDEVISNTTNSPAGRAAPHPSAQGGDAVVEQIRRAVKGLRFGEVRVIVHEGVVVQIERLEKQRLR